MTSGDAKTHFSLLPKSLWQPSCSFIRAAMSAANSTDTSRSIVENSQLGQNLSSEIQIHASLVPLPIMMYAMVRKLDVIVWCVSSLLQVPHYHSWCNQKKATIAAAIAAQPPNKQRRMTGKHDSYFLKRRMAMTMMMMRITAKTGPMTHNISGCSASAVTWIGSE